MNKAATDASVARLNGLKVWSHNSIAGLERVVRGRCAGMVTILLTDLREGMGMEDRSLAGFGGP